MAADIARHFATTRGMPDQGSALQVQRIDQGGQVVGIGIHGSALERLAGTAMATPVMRDDAVAVLSEEKHLVFPGVGRQGPAVAEDDGGATAPILVVNQATVGGLHGIAGMMVALCCAHGDTPCAGASRLAASLHCGPDRRSRAARLAPPLAVE